MALNVTLGVEDFGMYPITPQLRAERMHLKPSSTDITITGTSGQVSQMYLALEIPSIPGIDKSKSKISSCSTLFKQSTVSDKLLV